MHNEMDRKLAEWMKRPWEERHSSDESREDVKQAHAAYAKERVKERQFCDELHVHEHAMKLAIKSAADGEQDFMAITQLFEQRREILLRREAIRNFITQEWPETFKVSAGKALDAGFDPWR